MVISTLAALALRCPGCGKLEFYALSRFNLNRDLNCRITCECGACLLNVSRKGRKSYCLQIDCLMCDTQHVYTYKGSELWSDKVITLLCEDTGVEIGFIGPRELVMKSVKKIDGSIQEFAADLGCDKYFLNPGIMYQVLELLRSMSEEGVMSCGCGGSHLEVEVFPDRVELSCSSCGAVGIVFAETVKDLQWVHSMKGISLEPRSYRYLDEKRMHKKPVKK